MNNKSSFDEAQTKEFGKNMLDDEIEDDVEIRAEDEDPESNLDDTLDALRSEIRSALLKARVECDALGHPYGITTVVALNQIMERAVWDLGPSDLTSAMRRWLTRMRRNGTEAALHAFLPEHRYRLDADDDEVYSEHQENLPEDVDGLKTSDEDDEGGY